VSATQDCRGGARREDRDPQGGHTPGQELPAPAPAPAPGGVEEERVGNAGLARGRGRRRRGPGGGAHRGTGVARTRTRTESGGAEEARVVQAAPPAMGQTGDGITRRGPSVARWSTTSRTADTTTSCRRPALPRGGGRDHRQLASEDVRSADARLATRHAPRDELTPNAPYATRSRPTRATRRALRHARRATRDARRAQASARRPARRPRRPAGAGRRTTPRRRTPR